MIDGYLISPIGILEGVANFEEVSNHILNLDVLIVNDGGYFNELWCQPPRVSKIMQILAPVIIADDLGIPIEFLGNSFGPFGERSEFLISILSTLRKVHFRSRDRVGSIPELRRIGVEDSRISFIPDELFVLNAKLKQKSHTESVSRPYVVLELYQPLDVVVANRDVFSTFHKQMKSRGLDIVLLPFNEGRGSGDQAAWLSEEFGRAEAKLDDGYLSLEAAWQVTSESEFVLCERYRALLLQQEFRHCILCVQ